MSTVPPGPITRLLHAARDGEPDAFGQLMPLVYDELLQLARHQLYHERADCSLDPTALVHEVYMKLADQAQIDWHGRAHFYSIAARAMRQILVDHARKRRAQKRGGNRRRTTLMSRHLATEISWGELLDLEEALCRLDGVGKRLRKVVEYRFFGGMTEEEIACVLDVSARTVQRDWAKARAWLYKELYPNEQ